MFELQATAEVILHLPEHQFQAILMGTEEPLRGLEAWEGRLGRAGCETQSEALTDPREDRCSFYIIPKDGPGGSPLHSCPLPSCPPALPSALWAPRDWMLGQLPHHPPAARSSWRAAGSERCTGAETCGQEWTQHLGEVKVEGLLE